MIKKLVLGAVVMVAALGGPATLFWVTKYWNAIHQAIASVSDTGAKAPAEVSLPVATTNSPQSPSPPASQHPLEMVRSHELAEVLRFDVTPGWIMQQWPRVSTGLAKPQLEGYRVPLVTGAKPSDLAGSLTYYFDARQQVQEITFHGTTGELPILLQLLTTRYKFARRVTNDPGTIIYETAGPAGQSTSIARIRSAAILKADEPYKRFEVELELNRPPS
jgi:hypothetical protein